MRFHLIDLVVISVSHALIVSNFYRQPLRSDSKAEGFFNVPKEPTQTLSTLSIQMRRQSLANSISLHQKPSQIRPSVGQIFGSAAESPVAFEFKVLNLKFSIDS